MRLSLRVSGFCLLLMLWNPRPAPGQSSSYEQLQTFSGVLNQIRLNYVDSVNYGKLVRAAIDGVLNSLDPHSYFLSREDGMRMLAYEDGQLAGTGIILNEVDEEMTVQAVLPRSPAARAGVATGDRLLQLNDTTVAGLSAQTLHSRMLGERGSRIRLRFARGSRMEPDTFRVSIKYDFIEPRSVSVSRMVNQTTGFLRLQGFHREAGKEVSDALRKLRSSGARQVILDVRGNPGGIVLSAVEIASIFLPENVLVFRTEGRRRAARQSYMTEKDGSFLELPLIVLIDQGSASAAEALAGSLQDHDRALVMGRRSFGKALMQRPFEVPPAGDVVWLTVGHVITPSGRFIQRQYRGLASEQYRSLAGGSGAEEDTSQVFQSDGGRTMRGGGGIAPDVELAAPPPLPGWWSVGADSGFTEAVSDSVANSLPADANTKARFLGTPAQWDQQLVVPFLERIRTRLKVAAQPDSLTRARMAFILAARAVEVRWGQDALDEFHVRNDPDIQAAVSYFPRLAELLQE
jgi:carboxyl-terminal processing protease